MTTSNKLFEIYSGKSEIKGVYGPELEVEYTSIQDFKPLKLWNLKADDSLRNFGYEWVAKQPFGEDELKDQVKEVCSEVVSRQNYIDNCPRTSFHVHYNVSNLTPSQVVSSIVSYWLLEDVMVSFCKKHRIGNQYCLPASISTNVVHVLKNSIKSDNTFLSSFRDNDRFRYMGLNLCSVPKYMSLENRCMDGDAKNPDRLIEWCEGLNNIFNEAKSMTPEEVCDKAFHSPSDFMRQMFTGRMYRLFYSLGAISKVEEKVLQLSDLCYLVDWKEFDSKFKKKEKSKLTDFPAIRIGLVEPAPEHPDIIAGRFTAVYDAERMCYYYVSHQNPDYVGLDLSWTDYLGYYGVNSDEMESIYGITEGMFYDGVYVA